MFFGLTNLPATFQTMMNNIFREEIAEGWVVIYMDDILVFSKDKHEHQEQVKRILKKLRQHQLSLKAEKCYFEKEEIKFLGLIISEKGIRMDPHKVKANTKADLLSQRAGFPKGENDNENVILLKENHFRNIEIRLNEESREWLDLQWEIKKTH
jgi:hypothetical protein